MIKNKRQLSTAMNKLAGLQERLGRLKVKYPDRDKFLFYSEATADNISQLQSEISDFELAQSGDIKKVIQLWENRGTLHPMVRDDISIGEFLALLRICRRLSQAEFADLIGTQQANVARMEHRDYSQYALDILERAFSGLGIQIDLRPRVQEAA